MERHTGRVKPAFYWKPLYIKTSTPLGIAERG
jgi:hypothetical protein